MTKEEYYGVVRGAFDHWSNVYDERFRTNLINRYIRSVSLSSLLEAFKPSQTILEVGCGTGEEAIHLARRGISVVATDISSKMLKVLEYKVRRENLGDKVTTRQLGAADLDLLLDEEGEDSFEGAYSSLAALNCEPAIERVAFLLHRLIRPKGSFVASLKNRFCLMELLLYGLTFRPARAISRLRRPADVKVASIEISAYPYFPWEFSSLFKPYFAVERFLALPALLPPAEFDDHYRDFRRFSTLLERIDLRISSSFPFRSLGDYFLVTLSNLKP